MQQKTDDDDSGNDEPSDLAPPDFKDYFFQSHGSHQNSPEAAAAAAAVAPRRPEMARQPLPQPSKIDRYDFLVSFLLFACVVCIFYIFLHVPLGLQNNFLSCQLLDHQILPLQSSRLYPPNVRRQSLF